LDEHLKWRVFSSVAGGTGSLKEKRTKKGVLIAGDGLTGLREVAKKVYPNPIEFSL